MVFLRARISPRTSTVTFLVRSPLATAVVTSAMLRTWPVKLPAIEFTLSVRSFQTPATPRTWAWPPSLPSVPTSRATRVTSCANDRSWLTIVLTVRAVSRNWPCSRRPSMSIGIVCERSPLATAPMTRAISLFGRMTSSIRSFTESRVAAHAPPASPIDARLNWPSLPTRLLRRRSSRSRRWFDSMISLMAVATLAAWPVEVTGTRTLKSPRLTAVRTRSITLESVLSLARALLAMVCELSPFSRCVNALRGGYPELDLGPGSRLADDAAPATGKLGALLHGEETEVSGDVQALVDDKAGAVVGNLDHHPAVNGRGGDVHARGVRVLLDVRERLCDVPEDDRFHVVGKLVGEAQVDVGLDSGMESHALKAIADRFVEAHRWIESLRADVGEQSSQRILDLLDGRGQLVELRKLVPRSAVVAQAFQLELSGSQQLQRIVVKGARESAPGLVSARGDVGEEVAPGHHRFLETLDGDVELLFSLSVLPHETRRHRGHAEDPGVIARESALGVVGTEGADAPVARRPSDSDRVANPGQAVVAPEFFELLAGPAGDVELVAEDDALGDAFAVEPQLDVEVADR